MASARIAAIAFAIATTFLILTITSLPIVNAAKHHKKHAAHAHAKLAALKERMEIQAEAITYEWQTGTWSDCSATCGHGHKTRSVSCFGSDGSAVDDSLCDTATQPAHSESCQLEACASWTYGTWSDCSASCGAGTKTRSVTCIDHAGNTVESTECTDSSPSDSEECNLGECDVWTWSVGDWSDCSATCGDGVKTRQRECVNQNGDVSSTPDADCSSATSFVSQKTCHEKECTATQAAQGDTSSTQSASVTTGGDTESASLSTGTQIAATTGGSQTSATLSASAIASLSGYTGSLTAYNGNAASSTAAPSILVAVAVVVAAVAL